LQGLNQHKTLTAKLQEEADQKRLRDLQFKVAQRGWDDSTTARNILSGNADMGPPMPTEQPQQSVGQNFAGANPDYQPRTMPAPKGMGPGVGTLQSNSKRSMFDALSAQADKLESAGLPEKAMEYRTLAEKYRPELKDTKTLVDQTGQRVTVNFYKDGTREVVPFAPDKEKLHFADMGNAIQGMDSFTGAPVGGAATKGLTPSDRVTMRGQNITDARARELNAITREGNQSQVVTGDPNMGPLVVNKGTGQAKPVMLNGQPIPSEAKNKREAGAKNVLDLLNDAEQHIGTATNSFIGTGVDTLARGVGYATQGDKSIASLKAIEGGLLSQMPRMEGPQSDRDVKIYQQAAGMVGNPTVPRELKAEAIKAIRVIQERYVGGPTNQAVGKVRRYNPATGRIE
jgi:hypothetical protein